MLSIYWKRTLGNHRVSQATAIYLCRRLFHLRTLSENRSPRNPVRATLVISAIVQLFLKCAPIIMYSILFIFTDHGRKYLYEKCNAFFITIHIQFENHFITLCDQISAIICEPIDRCLFKILLFCLIHCLVLINHRRNQAFTYPQLMFIIFCIHFRHIERQVRRNNHSKMFNSTDSIEVPHHRLYANMHIVHCTVYSIHPFDIGIEQSKRINVNKWILCTKRKLSKV